MREPGSLVEKVPAVSRDLRDELVRAEAELTSKDPELSAAVRHDTALALIDERFGLTDLRHDGNAELLGIAGGIVKRRWRTWANRRLTEGLELLRARARRAGRRRLRAYQRGLHGRHAGHVGDDPVVRRDGPRDARAHPRRLAGLRGAWFNTATRAEALFGLGATLTQPRRRGCAAAGSLGAGDNGAAACDARASADTALPLASPEIRAFFNAAARRGRRRTRHSSARSASRFRAAASARRSTTWACSPGSRSWTRCATSRCSRASPVAASSVPATGWRSAATDEAGAADRDDYIELVQDAHRSLPRCRGDGPARQRQPTNGGGLGGLFNGEKGVLDPEETARALEQAVLPAAAPGRRTACSCTTFRSHQRTTIRRWPVQATFHPGRHNWLRAHKVPVLVLNATTMNTGHGVAVHADVDGRVALVGARSGRQRPAAGVVVVRAERGWQMELGRAVAASACVPGIFAPLEIEAPTRRRARAARRRRRARQPGHRVAAGAQLQRAARQRCVRSVAARAEPRAGSQGPCLLRRRARWTR